MTVTTSRYGLVGRNGTGKTTLLRALSQHQIKGIPTTTQILHVEQEVVGDDTTVLEAVLACDSERSTLLKVPYHHPEYCLCTIMNVSFLITTFSMKSTNF